MTQRAADCRLVIVAGAWALALEEQAMTESQNQQPALPAIRLPAPASDGSTSVFGALQFRRTKRVIAERPLPLQVLANLLWAARGANRPVGPFGPPGRTAASANHSQEIDLYVALQEGVQLYDALDHRLLPIHAGDLCANALIPGQ